jgi:hypothetical protein
MVVNATYLIIVLIVIVAGIAAFIDFKTFTVAKYSSI